MDKQNDTSNCNAESGFISPHKQPQTHPPLRKKTKLTKRNSASTETKKRPKKQQLQLHTNPNKEKTNRKTSEKKNQSYFVATTLVLMYHTTQTKNLSIGRKIRSKS